MSEITLKVTVPVLEELAKRDGGFVVQLSHAAAKEIGQKYGDAILQSAIVKGALDRLEKAIFAAQTEAGTQLENKIGEWDNSRNTGYRLRADVVTYIERSFEKIISDRFNKWIESNDVGAMLDKAASVYVERKLKEIMQKQLGDFLRK